MNEEYKLTTDVDMNTVPEYATVDQIKLPYSTLRLSD